MASSPRVQIPPVSWDVAAVILAAIGLALFLVPILGIPVSCAGALAGAIGLYAAWTGRTSSIRLSLAGLLISVFAVTIELAIMFGPVSYLEEQTTAPVTSPVPGRPYVPPPAPARSECTTIPMLCSGGIPMLVVGSVPKADST
jgi:hypothetical protein